MFVCVLEPIAEYLTEQTVAAPFICKWEVESRVFSKDAEKQVYKLGGGSNDAAYRRLWW